MKTKEFTKDLENKDIKQLSKQLTESRDRLHELRRDLSLSKVKNYREIRDARKQTAQIMTAINIKAGQIIETKPKESNDD